MQIGRAFLVLLGILTLSPTAGWAEVPDGNDGATRRLAEKSKQHSRSPSQCPALTMVHGEDPLSSVIVWLRITSDREAVSCLRGLAMELGPDRMLTWLEKNGFKARFIKQFGKSNRDILLSAVWPIRDAGLLYNPGGLWTLQIRLMAYNQVFSFWWRGPESLVVDQSYTFE